MQCIYISDIVSGFSSMCHVILDCHKVLECLNQICGPLARLWNHLSQIGRAESIQGIATCHIPSDFYVTFIV